MSEFVIRDAGLADAGKMAEIIADGREQTYGFNPSSRDYRQLVTNWRGERGAGIMQRYMQVQGEWAGLRDRPRARVATHLGSGALVGVMSSRQVPVHDEDGVNLDFLFVDPQMQGQGVGRLLMDDLTEYAAGRPQSLKVRADNMRAQGLYEKYGFVIRGAANSGYSLAASLEMTKPRLNVRNELAV